jgi:hypothetical protein
MQTLARGVAATADPTVKILRLYRFVLTGHSYLSEEGFSIQFVTN